MNRRYCGPERRSVPRPGSKPLPRWSKHWGCSRLAMVYWFIRMGMNLFAAAMRLWWHIPVISLAVLFAFIAAGCVEGGPWN